MTPRIVVVGLGPGGPELLTAATLAAIATTTNRFLQTERHEAASAVEPATSLDYVFERYETRGAAESTVVELLVEAAVEQGQVLYAVPGNPRLAEPTVDLLMADPRVSVDALPALSSADVAAPEFARLAELVLTLRRECPWDREQTHESLRTHLLEETYEVLEAIDSVTTVGTAESYAHLEEELGDLLYQVFFHAALASEEGRFGTDDVARGIHDKLRRRHPHVFGDVAVGNADEVLTNWEAIKKAEKQRQSALDGIPSALPALLLATKIQRKSGVGPVPDLDAAVQRFVVADEAGSDVALGELLQVTVAVALSRGLDPELELRHAAMVLADTYRVAEAAAAADGVDLGSADDSLRSRYL